MLSSLTFPLRPGNQDQQSCNTQPCSGTRGPPFPECRALNISCGSTCRSEVEEPNSWRREHSDLRFCDFNTGEVTQDKMEEMKSQRTLQPPLTPAM